MSKIHHNCTFFPRIFFLANIIFIIVRFFGLLLLLPDCICLLNSIPRPWAQTQALKSWEQSSAAGSRCLVAIICTPSQFLWGIIVGASILHRPKGSFFSSNMHATAIFPFMNGHSTVVSIFSSVLHSVKAQRASKPLAYQDVLAEKVMNGSEWA